MADAQTMNPEPPGNFSFLQMLPTLVYDVEMPIFAFNLLTKYGVSTLLALVAAESSPALSWTR
jgi:hypothetical protein